MDDELLEVRKEIKDLEDEEKNIILSKNNIQDKNDYNGKSYSELEAEVHINNSEYIVSQKLNTLKEREKALVYENYIIEKNKEFDKVKSTFKIGRIKEDIETTEDNLGRKMYADILAKYIVSRQTKTPFNVGIFGGWGEGKSSFLCMIEKQINNENADESSNYFTHVIRYDATEYSSKEQIWACVLKKLFEKFEDEKKLIGRFKFFGNRFINNFKKSIPNIIINTAVLIITWVIIDKLSDEKFDISKIFVYTFIGIVPLIITVINVIVPTIKSILKISIPISKTISKSITLPTYNDDLGKKENLRKDLEDLESVWFSQNNNNHNSNSSYMWLNEYAWIEEKKEKKERVVILIDEIDRCSEKAIVELMESLQLFLKSKNIIIIMAIDILKISEILYSNKENSLGHTIKYLEKYITIPIYISAVNDYDEYIDYLMDKSAQHNTNNIEYRKMSIVRDSINENNIFCFSDEEEELIKKILNRINLRNSITPRSVKRIFNILNLSKQMCIELSEKKYNDDKILFMDYIRWFFFSYFNPELAFEIEEKIKYIQYNSYDGIYKAYEDINNDIKSKYSNEYIWLLDEVKLSIKNSQLEKIKEISRLFIIGKR